MRVTPSVLAAGAGAGLLALAAISGCHGPAAPASPSGETQHAALTPGWRIAGASLFGTEVIGLPTGSVITPDAAPGSRLLPLTPQLTSSPGFHAGGASEVALSPDGRLLVAITSGFNRVFDPEGDPIESASNEYVFVFDVSGAASGDAPRQVQVLTVPNSFVGLAFARAGDRFYVSGGPDDAIHEFVRRAEPPGDWLERLPRIELGHRDGRGLGGLGIHEGPFVAGVATSASDRLVVAANHENDSITVIDAETRRILREIPLAPGNGVPGGEFPMGVAVLGEREAFVSCQRDREVDVVDLAAGVVQHRVRVGGEPGKLVLNRAGTRLYVANSNSDSVSVVDTASGAVVSEIVTSAPEGALYARSLRGSNPNALALSPDERTLYVTNGGSNTVAVVSLADGRVIGLVPTGFYPTAVSPSIDGRMLYVANAKSPTGPNPLGPWNGPGTDPRHPYNHGPSGQFILQLTEAGLLALPVPSPGVLAKLTDQALRNNRFEGAPDTVAVFASLRSSIKHVIYVVGENRTYDQILGDLSGLDGDPRLVHWGQAITPNHHALARSFVGLDRFFDAGGVSGDGWQWSTSARTTDVAERAIPLEYAIRGSHTYDWEGMNRNVNVALPTLAERIAANPHTPDNVDLLPGTADVGAVDGPSDGGRGFLWDAAIAAGLRVRNYGFFIDDSRYNLDASDAAYIPPLRLPFETHARVAYATSRALLGRTDPYFRGFDMALPDFWRVQEWSREFDEYVARGELPALELVRLPDDHLGKFDAAIDGVNTPDTQIADHDYALGWLVDRLSHSPFWKDTVVVAIEDDAQNGADHVDAHRSFAFFAGGHVRRGVHVSAVYTTPSILRTIELLLGLPPLGQEDGFAPAIAEVFTTSLDATPFVAEVPAVLRSTSLPLPPSRSSTATARPRGDAVSWALATRGFDFSRADDLPTARFNRVLYCGLVNDAGCTSPAPVLTCDAPETEP